MKKFMLILAVVFAIGLVSCSEDSSSTSSDDGTGEFSTDVTISTVDNGDIKYNFGGAYYDAATGWTTVILAKDQQTLKENEGEPDDAMFISIKGNEPGKYDLDGVESSIIMGYEGQIYYSNFGYIEVNLYSGAGGEIQFMMNGSLMTNGSSTINLDTDILLVDMYSKEDLLQ